MYQKKSEIEKITRVLVLSVSLAASVSTMSFASECLFVKYTDDLRESAQKADELKRVYDDDCSDADNASCEKISEFSDAEEVKAAAIVGNLIDMNLSFLDNFIFTAFEASDPSGPCARLSKPAHIEIYAAGCAKDAAIAAGIALYFSRLIDEIIAIDQQNSLFCGTGTCGVLESADKLPYFSVRQELLHTGGMRALRESLRVVHELTTHIFVKYLENVEESSSRLGDVPPKLFHFDKIKSDDSEHNYHLAKKTVKLSTEFQNYLDESDSSHDSNNPGQNQDWSPVACSD